MNTAPLRSQNPLTAVLRTLGLGAPPRPVAPLPAIVVFGASDLARAQKARGLGGAPSFIGLGAVNLTDATLLATADALYTALQTRGCINGFDQLVQNFQQAWVAAGGTLPNDSGGRSGIDGLYGTNTSNALAQIYTDALPGCVGVAAVTGPVSAAVSTALGAANPVSAYFADVMAGGNSLWATLGILGLVALGVVESKGGLHGFGKRRAAHKAKGKKRPKRRAPRRGRRTARRGRRARGRGRRRTSKRRRNPSVIRARKDQAGTLGYEVYEKYKGKFQIVAIWKRRVSAHRMARRLAAKQGMSNIKVVEVVATGHGPSRRHVDGAWKRFEHGKARRAWMRSHRRSSPHGW